MFSSLLVPLDGSAFGEHALPLALGIARRAGASLSVVHVHSPLEVMYAPDAVSFDEGLDARLKEGEQAYLDGVVKRLAQASPVPVAPVLLEGHVAASVREAATARGVDL